MFAAPAEDGLRVTVTVAAVGFRTLWHAQKAREHLAGACQEEDYFLRSVGSIGEGSRATSGRLQCAGAC